MIWVSMICCLVSELSPESSRTVMPSESLRRTATVSGGWTEERLYWEGTVAGGLLRLSVKGGGEQQEYLDWAVGALTGAC